MRGSDFTRGGITVMSCMCCLVWGRGRTSYGVDVAVLFFGDRIEREMGKGHAFAGELLFFGPCGQERDRWS